jgi:ATP-dependent RNA helicase HelY
VKLSMPEMPPATLLTALSNYNLLPAIVFLPTRRRCDQAASEAATMRRDSNDKRREERRDFLRSFVEQNPEIRGHRHWDTIIRGGVASHHAGHIPAWKLVIEKMMSAGLLDAIFATATVAAGVDFPARTVVLTVADARGNQGWRPLTASELQQMTGRAGRRGRDNVGFVVVAPGIHQDPERIAELLKSQPDPLVSQFRATYTTLLNLLDAFGSFAQVRQIAERSFAHRNAATDILRLERAQAQMEQTILGKVKASGCELDLSSVTGFERLVSARSQLQDSKPQTRAEMFYRWLDEQVQPGRVVGIGRTGRRLVLVTEKRDGNVRGIREDGRSASFGVERIGRVYSPTYRLKEEFVEEAFEDVRTRGRELVLHEPRLKDARAEDTEALQVFDDRLDSILPKHLNADEKLKCTETLWSVLSEADELHKTMRRIESLRDEVWEPFEQRARVLSMFGYLDFVAEKTTERGRWLADLHVDRPLLIGQALENGLFNHLSFSHLAAIIAALTADEDRDYGELELEDPLVKALAQIEEVAFTVSTEEWKQGIEPAPELNFSAAAATANWATGMEWADLVDQTRAEEGDLFRMLSRTGEALLQIAGLRKAHPRAAHTASIAADAVLREPVR